MMHIYNRKFLLIGLQVLSAVVAVLLAWAFLQVSDAQDTREWFFYFLASMVSMTSLAVAIRFVHVIITSIMLAKITLSDILFLVLALVVCTSTYLFVMFAGLMLVGFA